MSTVCNLSDPDFINKSTKISGLGSGTFGSVSLYNTPMGKCVIKQSKRVDHSPGYPPDFLNEIDALYKFRSVPSIINIIGVGFNKRNQTGYIIMDHMKSNLRKWYSEATYLERVSAIPDLLNQIGGALAVMHYFNIIHNDIKNNNILTNSGKEFRLADFGKSQYVYNPYMIYGALSKYCPYKPRTVFEEELYAFCIVVTEIIVGGNLIRTKSESEEEDIKEFYDKYGTENGFDVKEFLIDKLPLDKIKLIPDEYWKYVIPVFEGRTKVTAESCLDRLGLKIPDQLLQRVKRDISWDIDVCPNIDRLVRKRVHQEIYDCLTLNVRKVSSRRIAKVHSVQEFCDRILRKVFSSTLDVKISNNIIGEVILILLLGKRYKPKRPHFKCVEELLLYENVILKCLDYQLYILEN